MRCLPFRNYQICESQAFFTHEIICSSHAVDLKNNLNGRNRNIPNYPKVLSLSVWSIDSRVE